jgi:predicted oxidoreductase
MSKFKELTNNYADSLMGLSAAAIKYAGSVRKFGLSNHNAATDALLQMYIDAMTVELEAQEELLEFESR